jgi:zinc D-Ala-D-Ala carboxypeptidase
MVKMISEHVSFKEGTFSATATRLGLPNNPSEEHLANMQMIAKKIFEPLRVYVGGPIKINSFYRGPELNKAIGGSKKSQHWIKEYLDFDQMIWEFGNDENPDWVHVSYVDEKTNRNRCLKASRVNGKTTYQVI